MNTNVHPKEGFRKGFVLTLTLAYTVAFLAMLSGFFEALLLAAVFSGLTYPLNRWLLRKLGGRKTPASLLTLVITLFAILIPLIFLLALVAEQALAVAQQAKPWIAQQLAQSGDEVTGLPEWIPFADRLEPFRDEIMAVLSILPGSGAPLVWVPAVIYLLMSGQVVAGIGLLVWSAGVVGSIDNFLRPVLVGRDTKMPDEARLPRSCRQADQGMSPAGTDIGWRDRHALSPYVTSTGLEVARRAGEAPCFRSPACY